jgi:predicted RNA-binding Zn-ribbon protein involved in translation (DUF1610 family)
MSFFNFWDLVRTEKETSYGHGPGGVFSGPGAAGGAMNAMQLPAGGGRRQRRKKKKTIKEIVIAVSQNGGPPEIVEFPDPAERQVDQDYIDETAEPCPACDVFIALPPDDNSEWFQCPNCGEYLYIVESDSDYVDYHSYSAAEANQLYGVNPPDIGAPMALMSSLNDNAAPAAVQYKAVSLVIAALKANYNAKAGETIAGNLARGGDGKFASGGGAGKDALGTDQASLDEVKKRVAAMHEPKGGKGKGKAAPKGKGKAAPKGKGKAAPKGKKAKPSADEKDAAKLKIQGENLEKVLGADLTEAITAVQDDPETSVNEPFRTQLLEKGLIQENPGGTTSLTGAGRSLMSASASNNQKSIKLALNRGRVISKANAARQVARDQKKADRAQKLRDKADDLETTTKETGASATSDGGSAVVFKQSDGRYRWITFTSSSFKDKDRQTVSQSALERDVERADASGDFGPLRWFHVPGADIGDCDFNTMIGRVLVESGTFKNNFVAEKLAASASELEVSAGFLHPITEPDADGVFHNIRRFERSLLPKGKASNLLTQFMVKENSMANLAEKLKGLAGLLGGTPEAETIVNSLALQAETATKAATDAGITYKAAGDPASADATASTADAEEEAAESPEEEAAEETYIGDMTAEDFESYIGGILDKSIGTAVAKALAAHSAMSNVATKEELSQVQNDLANVRAEIAAPVAAATKAASDLAEINTTVGQVAGRLAQAEKSITGLIGDAPRTVKGYVASQSIDTVVSSAAIKSGPAGDELDEIATRVAASFGG